MVQTKTLRKYLTKIKKKIKWREFQNFSKFQTIQKCFDYNIHNSFAVIEFAKNNRIKIFIQLQCLEI